MCARWELHCTPIGEVAEHGELRALWGDEVVGSIPARLLTDECPRYEVEQTKADSWAYDSAPLSDANRADKSWIYEQYDQLVGSRTVRRPGLDAGVLRLRPSLRGLAVSLQGPRPGERDPFAAGVQAVLGAARNVACAGGEPIGLTDCLNFGNPEKPEIANELAQAIEGISRAAEVLGIPVVSGNVSLYNDTDGRSIPPTPVVGCVGLVPDVRLVPGALAARRRRPPRAGARVEPRRRGWRSSASSGRPRRFSRSAHDVGYGGLEQALAEAAALERARGRRRPASPSRRAARRSSPPLATRLRDSARAASSRSECVR